jgi:hypothetical protein
MKGKVPIGPVAKAFDRAERGCRDVARTLGHPEWNGFLEAVKGMPEQATCPVGCTHISRLSVDVVVSHLARRHLWEPEDILHWLEEHYR